MDLIGIALFFLGISFILLTVIDIFQTVIQIGGGGVMSKFFSEHLWKFFVWIAGGDPQSKILAYAGGFILASLFFFWIILLWAGFSLIYLSEEAAVVDTNSGRMVSTVGKIYYVGYTLTSLGNGDLKSGSDAWRLMSNFMGITSMFIVTLSISYLLPVLQAALSKRVLAKYINQMGDNPQEILIKGWNGKDFSLLYNRMRTLDAMILKHTENHLAYPILHYFHAERREFSAPLNLAKLDEALTCIQIFELDPSATRYNWQFLRKSLDDFVEMAKRSYVQPEKEAPPFHIDLLASSFPQIEKLNEGLPVIQSDLNERRKLLLGLVQKDCWKWTDVYRTK